MTVISVALFMKPWGMRDNLVVSMLDSSVYSLWLKSLVGVQSPAGQADITRFLMHLSPLANSPVNEYTGYTLSLG